MNSTSKSSSTTASLDARECTAGPMKRWQDRGEVLDSDDDEALDLELEHEWEAHSPVRKEVRTEERTAVGSPRDGRVSSVGNGTGRGAAEDDWLRPKAANPYGRRSRITRSGTQHSPSTGSPQSVKAADLVENGKGSRLGSSQRADVDNAVDRKSPNALNNTANDGDQPEENSSPASKVSATFAEIARSQTMLLELEPEQQPELDAPSSDTEQLPGVRDLLNIGAAVPGRGRPESRGNVSSGLSSPLSERSISPPTPVATFRFPRPEISNGATGSVDLSGTSQDDSQPSATPDDVVEPTRDGKRTFRARKAQQLHPYEYEKMQYQKQFRERGLRPVRVVATEREALGKQNGNSSDNEQDSWQPSQPPRSSPSRPATKTRENPDPSDRADRDDEFSDLALFNGRTAIAVIPRGPKRQKLSHHHHDPVGPSTARSQLVDEFSVPPSPPPTSSESNDNGNAVSKPAVFRFPRGMTPNARTQQPTPNVSSETRRTQADRDDEVPRRSKLSTISRPRHAPIPVDSSSESSQSDSEPNVDPDVRRLLKERKRIRGVLPASWLKIDLKAQQKHPSPTSANRRERETESPGKIQPQRGVAQRILPRVSGSATHASIPISDDESDNDLSTYLSPSKKRQSRLQFDRSASSVAPTDYVDDDGMEVDYVDAMLAGSSRPKPHHRSSKKRQPRIMDAFYTGRSKRPDFAEERRAARQATGASSVSTKKSHQQARRQRIRKPSVPLRSIVDAPTSSTVVLPQFVKLAVRRARGQQDNGRHSPSRKHIRLATECDTEEATSVLQAWREGTVAPRQGPLDGKRHQATSMRAEKSSEMRLGETPDAERLPLAVLSSNQQGRLPQALRTTAAKQNQQAGAKRLSVPKTKTRQSRLQPVTLDLDHASEHPDTTAEDYPTAPPNSHNQRSRPRPRASQSRYRGAQIETLESDFDRGHREAAFERRMHLLTENVMRGRSSRTPAAPVQLERFLYEPDAAQPQPNKRPELQYGPLQQRQTDGPAQEQIDPRRRLVHRPRKRIPQRLDAEARQYRQPSEPLLDVISLDDEPVTFEQASINGPILQGLGPYGARYAFDFDTLPLPLGTYFHESSFIGSGDFAASLDFAGRNLDFSTGRIRIHIDADIFELGIWTEEVAVGLARIPPAVSDALVSLGKDRDLQGCQDSPDLVLANVDYLLRSTVRYFTRCLAFSDSIDRCACIRSLQRFIEDTVEVAAGPSVVASPYKDIVSRCLQYAATLARQAVTLCNHPIVPLDLSHRTEQLLQRAAGRLANHTIQSHMSGLRSFYEDIRRAAKREAGIHDSDAAICSITVLHHVLSDLECTQNSFWAVLYRSMEVQTEHLASTTELDRIWRNLFTILPALEIDSHGILQLGSRLYDAKEEWSLPKALVERLFQLYPATSVLAGSTINAYVRATFSRCSRLQSRWGWYRCEPILHSISDFFARRGLSQLHKEQSHGSPAFLEELDQQPSVEVHVDDHSFHIFVKMLAGGLRNMRDQGTYPDKKIGGIAWRFIPNHGRMHRKDADVRQEDLDALRNHHDLLCTIYYASPPENRLRVDLIQNLVDHTASHREACRLNVRAWRNLAAFQASADEVVERLEPFNNWFRELLTANIMQFRLAKTEVEQDAASAVMSGKPAVSQDAIDSVIAANQRQIAATIIDGLAAVKHVIKSSSSLKAVSTVVEGTAFSQVFDLFDPAARKVFGMFDEGLEVVKTALEMQRKFRSEAGSQVGSDDSQDYGDSGALQELASTQMPGTSSGADALDILHSPVAGFVSSVYGADGMTDDKLLVKVIDVWADIAGLTVSQGKKDWQTYISSYGPEAWSQLRDTEQRRKYTPYFLARVAADSNIDLIETGISTFWLRSLVEREATLKFQHVLTNALLNRQGGEPLLANLPFIRPSNGQFAVSLHELRQSRLGLISSVLSNMHQHLDNTTRHSPARLPNLRRTYAEMLRGMMQAMKANYQEVQGCGSGDFADPNAQGGYIGFVQQVVSFLQQYTTDICPIDRFFTDSTAFPLPAEDPTYVVGRLKSYVPKLSASNKRKELSVFVQTVSERAAVDGKQGYLVDQLTAAMSGVLERGDPRAPSLRHVLMTAVLPAYIDKTLSTACSWILALPILQACGRTISDLLYNVQIEDEQSLQAALDTIGVPVTCMLQSVQTVLTYPGQLMFTHVLATLTTIFEAVQQSLTAMHHLARAGKDQCLVQAAGNFSQCALTIQDLVSGDEFVDPPGPYRDSPAEQSHWPETQEFSRKQFRDNMSGWQARDGQYFMRRGPSSVEVVVHLGDEAEERGRLLEALQWYLQSYEAVFGRRRSEETMSATDEVVV